MPDLPHASRLRAGRYSQSGQIYLLTAVTQTESRCLPIGRPGDYWCGNFNRQIPITWLNPWPG